MSEQFRRPTHAVRVGRTAIGGDNPIRIQSMTNTPTLDTKASARQTVSIARAGADLVRLTAQGVSHARNLAAIRDAVRAEGCDVPLVADIHFNPAAAFEAALHVEKVRINPGNFVDPGRTFKKLEYTDEEYAAELSRIDEKLTPFLELCREHGTALRIGVNHGSLSDRIMSRYGDTPAGMVESAMEFLRICERRGFADVVVSIKASNVQVMVETVRLLVDAMEREGMDFPLHLGVTEAGDGEDGRVKSAVGIGTLLSEGIGDTIRVSLSEAPEAEIPVAQMLVDHIGAMSRPVPRLRNTGRVSVPQVVGVDLTAGQLPADTVRVAVCGPDALFRAKTAMSDAASGRPTLLHVSYPESMTPEEVTIAAAVDMGSVLLDGYSDYVELTAPQLTDADRERLTLGILQATRRRITRTEYIACPGCGRTLFPLSEVLGEVRRATSHLTGLKIAVMGCVVNGPGEMSDADYGYVGAAAGHVSLYRRRECLRRNIPASEAVEALVALIKECGDWTEPAE